MVKCPFAVPTCKCYDCACNASYDECNQMKKLDYPKRIEK